ncbi:MAG: hypothetical protein PHN75_04560, partial [Syntrophales bacterium]|nr:hypothetical protein [Syntrophales bacterium]
DKAKLRDDHLYKIKVPMLFFAGTRDPLCDLELLKPVIGKIGSRASLEVVEGGNHSFEVPKSYQVSAESVHERISTKITAWLNGIRRPDASTH